MLKHYDSLNWQIGSVLIAGVLVMTGLAVTKDTIELIRAEPQGWVVVFAIPLLSAFVLGAWWLWFRRHRDLYNLRNEVMHRVEAELGMYHFLLVAHEDLRHSEKLDGARVAQLEACEKAAQSTVTSPFARLYDRNWHGPSGASISTFLTVAIPVLQFIALALLGLTSAAPRSEPPRDTPAPAHSQASGVPSAQRPTLRESPTPHEDQPATVAQGGATTNAVLPALDASLPSGDR